jgi:GntR family transcriptional regulator/MocR family aminotransferase
MSRFVLDRTDPRSLQDQLAGRIRAAVADGRLAPGSRLASSRALAAQLGLARGTVDAAYARLAGEGLLVTRGPGGTIVSPVQRPNAGAAPAPLAPPARPPPFRMGLPALDLFPRALWARLVARAARRASGAALAYPDPAGLADLRTAVASYLAVARGVACAPGQVIVTAGYQALLARLLLRPGEAAWCEDPGYPLAARALEAAGARVLPLAVDAEGAAVPPLDAARLAVLTPAHQSPTGVALSARRRRAMLDWADRTDGFLIEDDYDAEFHYAGVRPPALKSRDAGNRVILAGSFSKTLFPGLRLGYLVVPAVLQAAAVRQSRLLTQGAPELTQATVAEFLAEGHFARHLRRMRAAYAARRAALAAAVTAAFAGRLTMAARPGGLHLLALCPEGTPPGWDLAAVARAEAAGLAPAALSAQFLEASVGAPRAQGLLLGFTNIAEAEAGPMAAALGRAVGPLPPGPPCPTAGLTP